MNVSNAASIHAAVSKVADEDHAFRSELISLYGGFRNREVTDADAIKITDLLARDPRIPFKKGDEQGYYTIIITISVALCSEPAY